MSRSPSRARPLVTAVVLGALAVGLGACSWATPDKPKPKPAKVSCDPNARTRCVAEHNACLGRPVESNGTQPSAMCEGQYQGCVTRAGC
jgi:hypothetical protein